MTQFIFPPPYNTYFVYFVYRLSFSFHCDKQLKTKIPFYRWRYIIHPNGSGIYILYVRCNSSPAGWVGIKLIYNLLYTISFITFSQGVCRNHFLQFLISRSTLVKEFNKMVKCVSMAYKRNPFVHQLYLTGALSACYSRETCTWVHLCRKTRTVKRPSTSALQRTQTIGI